MLLPSIILINVFSVVYPAKILGFFFIPSISHQVVYQSIWKELSLRGHEVTVMSPNPLKNASLKNLTEIDLKFSYSFYEKNDLATEISKDNSMLTNVMFVDKILSDIIQADWDRPEVQKLFEDDSKRFDLILVECLHPLVFGLKAKYNVPIIGVSSLGVFLNSHDSVGNPTHPVLNPDLMLNIEGEMSFYDRSYSAFYNIWFRLLYHWYTLPRNDRIARKYFGDDIPYLGDLEKTTSLILVNSNPILHPIRPNVPAVIEMGQMHLNKKKPLPTDIQKYLDQKGFIYFSLGSNVKSSNLTDDVRKIICEALSELPYNVLWKWETDHLPDQPKNVMIKKWLPQQDVLGHPNLKAFLTQGGLQSVEEAITNGVPLVGMPFFGDQPLNVAKMVKLGIAAGPIDFKTMTKDELKTLILEVTENSTYRTKVEELRNLLRDQPMTGLEKAVWWIEYVIRYKGATHLRSSAVDMPWYQKTLLDVYVAFGVGTALMIYVPILIFKHFQVKF